MSENEDSQEKTEEPTSRRLEEAIEQGQILTSKDLVMSTVLLVGALELYFAGRYLFQELTGAFSFGLNFIDPLSRDVPLHYVLGERFGSAVLIVLAFSIPLALVAIATQSMLGGFHFTLENLAPKASRISPMAGFSRMFGSQALIELGKAIAKVVALGTVGFWYLTTKLPEVLRLSEMPFGTAVEKVGSLFIVTLLVLVGATAVLGMGDAFIQWRQHSQRLLMTKQEMKDESKQTEGSPEVKSRIRRMQQEMATRGSVAKVEEAQVVIVNPQHFAVALHYDFEEGSAPKVLSKGSDAVAASIREKAESLGIPVLTMPLLARALYFTSEIGSEIHSDLYRAVATVLSFVFQAGAVGDVPEVEIPDELQFDANGRKQGGRK